MAETVNLDVTTLEESVSVTTTDGGTVEVAVQAEKGDAATITIGTTTTGNAGTNASVTNSGTTSAAVFNFTIPRGAAGPNTVTSATTTNLTGLLIGDGNIVSTAQAWTDYTPAIPRALGVYDSVDPSADGVYVLNTSTGKWFNDNMYYIQNSETAGILDLLTADDIVIANGSKAETFANQVMWGYILDGNFGIVGNADIVTSHALQSASKSTALPVDTLTAATSVNIADNGVDPVVSMTISGFSVGATALSDGAIYLSKGPGEGSFIQTTNVTSVRTFELPNASGTIALTTSNVATATALETSRNIFGIAFNGTSNVSGDATNTGHFASIPVGGAAGHFITLNGTAPTVIAGRSAWWSDASGNPSFRNGTGTAVTLVRSSDLGTGVATALAVNVGSAGAIVVNGGALGTPSSGTLTNCTGLPISTGVSGLASNVATFLATPSSANLAAAVTDETGNGSLVFAQNSTLSGTTLTSLERNTLGRIAALTMSQSPPCSLFEDFCGTSGAGIYTWTNSGTGSDSIGATGQNCFGVRRMTTGTTSGNQRKTILPIPTSTIFGTEIRAHFAIPDVTTCDAFIGMEQTSGAFGRYFLLYAAALNSGRWILLTGTGAGVFTNFGTNGPSNGNFASGKRYRSIMRVINATTVYVKIDEADWNADNWSNLHDANVTITSYTPSADPMALDIRVNTQTNAARSLDIDYISVENTSIVR